MSKPIEWVRSFAEGPEVRGTLHSAVDARDVVVLTHGAGGDKNAKLLVLLAEALGEHGIATLRIDLPYRQRRPAGPPRPSKSADDRAGIMRAADSLRESYPGRMILAGSSYGGRQASMLAAEDREAADALLLLSYPLHPPGKPENLRTDHWPRIAAPVFFAHGTRDAFGSQEEVESARKLLRVHSETIWIEGATHGLISANTGGKQARRVAGEVARAFANFVEAI